MMNFLLNLPRSVQVIIVTNIVIVIGFGTLLFSRGNAEFMLYMLVILLACALILVSYTKLQYPPFLLWLLTIWGFLHLAGGLLYARGDVWYNLILVDIIPSIQILKYDQAVHAFGFFTATILVFYIIKPYLKKSHIGFGLGLVLVAAGSGLGAWNEIIEFFAQATVEGANVGGYLNTSLDTIFNLFGALAAVLFLKICEVHHRDDTPTA